MTKRRVLIVDDEELVRLSLRDMLELTGYEVVGEAADGNEAVRQVAQLHPDVVLMDIAMPNKDGITAAREISASYPVPIVFLTGYADSQNVASASQAGAYAYLVKPCRQADLAPAIEMAVARFAEGRRYQQEAQESRWALETIRRLVRSIAENPDIQGVVDLSLRGAASLLRAPAAALFLVRDDELRVRAHVGLDAQIAAASRTPIANTIFGEAVTERKPASCVARGDASGLGPWALVIHPFGLCSSALAVPVQAPLAQRGARALGCLAVFRPESEPFSDTEVALLATVAGELELAFQTAQMRHPMAWRLWLSGS